MPNANLGIVVQMDQSRLAMPPAMPAPSRVLLVEHPTPLAATLAAGLKAAGMEAEIAASVAEALHVVQRFHPTVVLLHAAGSPPRELAQIPLLARGGDCGVIVLLDRDGEAARIGSLDGGADDVVPSLAPLGELAARIRAVQRRVARGQPMLPHELSGPVALDPAHRCLVAVQGERTSLSEAEFIALETLLDADGAPVSRDWLGRVALKRPLHAEDRSVDQLVLKLRRKLVAAGASERTILSARRQGYVIADPSRVRSLATASQDGEGARPLVRAEG